MNSQTKNSSYAKLFLDLEFSEDFFEIEVLKRIKEDYEKFHTHNYLAYETTLQRKIICPKCNSNSFISYGHDRNGTRRYKCKLCGKLFNFSTDSLFFSSKVNLKAWFTFLECILSETSTKVASITAKISTITASKWLEKVFWSLRNYQDNIILNKEVYIDETYVQEDKSKIYLLEETGKVKKTRKQPRGISRNKICILAATDNYKSFMEVECHGRPQRLKNYEICKKHIQEGSLLIGDEDTSMAYAAKQLNCTREMHKSYTDESFITLEPIDQLCKRFKFFISKHKGFTKDRLQDYINLFVFIDNEKKRETDLYKITTKLLKIMSKCSKNHKKDK